MARRFPLQIVYDLARQRVEAAERTVKQAHGNWLRARAQMVRLQTERRQYVQQLAEQRGKAEAGFYPAAVEGWQVLNRRMKLGRQQVDAAHDAWQNAMRVWHEQERRVRALTVLLQRHRDELTKRDAVRERKLHDEISARNFLSTRQEAVSGRAWEEHLS